MSSESTTAAMTAPCPWCGHPTCDGDQPSQPHHSLCCLDRGRLPCWGNGGAVLDRIMRDDNEDRYSE